MEIPFHVVYMEQELLLSMNIWSQSQQICCHSFSCRIYNLYYSDCNLKKSRNSRSFYSLRKEYSDNKDDAVHHFTAKLIVQQYSHYPFVSWLGTVCIIQKLNDGPRKSTWYLSYIYQICRVLILTIYWSEYKGIVANIYKENFTSVNCQQTSKLIVLIEIIKTNSFNEK